MTDDAAQPDAEEATWVPVARKLAGVKAVYLDYPEDGAPDPDTGMLTPVRYPLEAPVTVGALATLQRIDESEALTNALEVAAWLLWYHAHRCAPPPFKDMDVVEFMSGVDMSTVEVLEVREPGEVSELMDPKAPSSSPPDSPTEPPSPTAQT